MTSYGTALEEARRCLEQGELVIHPTEAVYGFGGLLDDAPLQRLRRLKKRPAGGFVVLLPSAKSVVALLDARGRALAREFWPGPLTLVLEDPEDRFHPHAKAPDGTVAVRVPAHPVTLRLLREAGRPITSTSANRPGFPPARTAGQAREEALALGTELFAIDAGSLPGGAPSTLVRLGTGCPELIRQGPLDLLELRNVMSPSPSTSHDRRGVPPGGAGDRVGRDSSTGCQRVEPTLHITFVCTGNTCRSPMAEAIARRAVVVRGMTGVTLSSAGVAAHPGAPASEGARRVAAEAGLDLDGHRSTPLTEEVVAASALVLCMDGHHLWRAVELGGGEWCRLLSEMAGETGDVGDPFGGADDTYRATFSELARLVRTVLDRIAAGEGGMR